MDLVTVGVAADAVDSVIVVVEEAAVEDLVTVAVAEVEVDVEALVTAAAAAATVEETVEEGNGGLLKLSILKQHRSCHLIIM